ncbi:hypothetical protein [uncultured Shimia sp.]|uniref:hypothetical protein n=1 Tax=uncultured Shimia sp. TaxID=573152 RepID=UPI0026056ACE|nr:hypothetical protein [uncultured Shimia sp.]
MEQKKKKIGVFKQAVLNAQEKAGNKRIEKDGYVLHQYPDLDTYREVQIAGNKAKLGKQFVRESHIKILSNYINEEMGQVAFGICQGTRRGAEQAWFRTHLTGEPNVIGTEISDTADQFPNTVQWDFHKENPEWKGKADFIYSNSWDHAFDPEAAFKSWVASLKVGGRMFLDHTKGQSPDAANALDPFGIEYGLLVDMLSNLFEGKARLLDAINTRRINKEYRARVIVLERTA